MDFKGICEQISTIRDSICFEGEGGNQRLYQLISEVESAVKSTELKQMCYVTEDGEKTPTWVKRSTWK